MAYDTGRQALRQEIELLKSLQQATDRFRESVAKDPVASLIANGWAGSFEKLQKLNADLIADSDKDFKEALTGEKELLKSYLNVAGSNGFAWSWKELFESDIKVADQLLKP
jgi:glycerate kinase